MGRREGRNIKKWNRSVKKRGKDTEATEVPPLPPPMAAKPALVDEVEDEDSKWVREQMEADAAAEALLEEEAEDNDEGDAVESNEGGGQGDDDNVGKKVGSKRALADDERAKPAKKTKGEGRDDTGGGWQKEKAQRLGGSVGKDGGDATYRCRACQQDLKPEAFNAKKLNGVRRGWVDKSALACKSCNALAASVFALEGGHKVKKYGGPMARAKKEAKSW